MTLPFFSLSLPQNDALRTAGPVQGVDCEDAFAEAGGPVKGVDGEGCVWGCGLCTRVQLLWNKAVFFVSKRPFICRLNSPPGDGSSPFKCASWQLNLPERYGPHKKADLPVKPPSESIQIWLSLALSFIGDAIVDLFLKIHPLPLIFMLPEIYYSRGQ